MPACLPVCSPRRHTISLPLPRVCGLSARGMATPPSPSHARAEKYARVGLGEMMPDKVSSPSHIRAEKYARIGRAVCETRDMVSSFEAAASIRNAPPAAGSALTAARRSDSEASTFDFFEA